MRGPRQLAKWTLALPLALALAMTGAGCDEGSSSGGDNSPTGGGGNAALGTWVGTTSPATGALTLTFKADLTGTSTWDSSGAGSASPKSFTYSISGNHLSWSQEPNTPSNCGGPTQIINVTADISGSTMTGSYTAPAAGTCPEATGAFTATRQ